MKRSKLDRLMKRYVSGKANAEEIALMEAVLEKMKAEDVSDIVLTPEQEDALLQDVLSRKDAAARVYNRGRVIRMWTPRIAATLLVIALVSYAGWYFGSTGVNRVSFTAHGTTEKVKLPDGSLVWLRDVSELVYMNKQSGDIRYTELKGEALFEVAKDAAHPFVIQCGSVSLKVVGTSFSLKSTDDSVQLSVLTGRVRVSLPDNQTLDVKPHEKFIFTHGLFTRSVLTAKDEHTATMETNYNMRFEDATLADAIEALQDKFDVQINLANAASGRCHLSADLTDRSLESSLQILVEVLDIQYTQNNSLITISGNGCN